MTQSTRLRGGDHETIGEIATLAEGSAAIAISRGGAAKTYRYRHRNEDVVGFVHGSAGSLAVVADGHGGRQAAELALAFALDELAPRWIEVEVGDLKGRFDAEARGAAVELHRAILRAALEAAPQPCRTTVSVALVRPGEGWFGHWSVGDSHVFEVRDDAAHEPCAVAQARVCYLGDAATTNEALADGVRVAVCAADATRCLVLATDGLSEAGSGVADPPAAIRQAVAEASTRPLDLRPLETARAVVLRALASHGERRAGDNIATAVLWLEDLADPDG